MIINIFENKIYKKNIDLDKAIFVKSKLVDKYDAVINDNVIIVNKTWYDSTNEETNALYNLKQQNNEKTNIFVEIDENISFKQIPEFAVTIENNINIQQFNLTKEEFNNDSYIKNIIISYSNLFFWNLDKELYIGNRKYFTEEKFNRYIQLYKKNGYLGPITLYVDKDNIRVYYNDYVAYIYALFNFNSSLPIRILTYKDINYIKNIDVNIYNKLKEIPNNKFYKAEDKEDFSKYMIKNYSDKKEAVKKYFKDRNLPKLDTNKEHIKLSYNNKDEFLPYVFTRTKEYLNKELIDNIFNHKHNEYFYKKVSKNEYIYSMPISEYIYKSILGYTYTMDSKWEDILDNPVNSLKVIDEVDFDPSLFSLDTFNYDTGNINNLEKSEVIKAFGPYCVYDKVPVYLTDMTKLNDVLNNDIKIKVLSRK